MKTCITALRTGHGAEKEFSENDEIVQKRRDLHGVIIFGTASAFLAFTFAFK